MAEAIVRWETEKVETEKAGTANCLVGIDAEGQRHYFPIRKSLSEVQLYAKGIGMCRGFHNDDGLIIEQVVGAATQDELYRY